jgi:hypothetical protein
MISEILRAVDAMATVLWDEMLCSLVAVGVSNFHPADRDSNLLQNITTLYDITPPQDWSY